jgi:hypothetical protein
MARQTIHKYVLALTYYEVYGYRHIFSLVSWLSRQSVTGDVCIFVYCFDSTPYYVWPHRRLENTYWQYNVATYNGIMQPPKYSTDHKSSTWIICSHVRFQTLTSVVMKSSIIWDTTPCSPLKVNCHFGCTCLLNLQLRRINQTRNWHEAGSKFMLISCLAYSSALKMVSCSSETLVDFQMIIWSYISQKTELFNMQPHFQINMSQFIINMRIYITSYVKKCKYVTYLYTLLQKHKLMLWQCQ